jgi:5-methylcytosine-specific restriction protein A
VFKKDFHRGALMPGKPPKYCAAFPCRNVAAPGSAYCKEHRPAPARKETDPFYLSPRWRRFRNWYITAHPLCELCLAEGREEGAVIVDHRTELKDGGAPFDENNAQSLCGACHNRKTAEEKQKRGAIVYSYSEKSSATLGK